MGTCFTETLETDASKTPEYPFAVRQTLSGILEEDGSATIIQEVTNLESMKSIPVSMGIHPYFNIQASEKRFLKFECIGGDLIETAVEHWSNGGTTSIANPRTLDPHASLRVTIPSLGVLTLTASPEYQRIWVWSLPGKDFLCIEPVLRDVGGLVKDPVLVSPGETFSAQFNIQVE
jgi:galactose mutarotase-like enzyme